MSKLILLVVAAAWAAVLLPPLFRSRLESRPGSSVSSFRRQLSSLQRSTPGGNMAQMRSMARPLTSAPRPGAVRSVPGRSPYAPQSMQRTAGRPSAVVADRYDLRTVRPLERRAPATQGQRRTTVARRSSVRQRRQNVLFLLVLSTVVTGFLALATHATAMKFALAATATMLVVYIYMLAQSRRLDDERSMREMWERAA
jgi:hypothetical protein